MPKPWLANVFTRVVTGCVLHTISLCLHEIPREKIVTVFADKESSHPSPKEETEAQSD